jgi:hypothetical protein
VNRSESNKRKRKLYLIIISLVAVIILLVMGVGVLIFSSNKATNYSVEKQSAVLESSNELTSKSSNSSSSANGTVSQKKDSQKTSALVDNNLLLSSNGTTFYDESSGLSATISQVNELELNIEYKTTEGTTSASFTPDWEEIETGFRSITPMYKQDGNTDFTIEIDYDNLTDEFRIEMEDGTPQHEMNFSSIKSKIADENNFDAVLNGNLESFAGQFSTETFNKEIAESDFTLGGYSAEDYYNNATSVFPSITKDSYWNGMTSHGLYQIKSNDLPKKVNGYYVVNFYGVNNGANDGILTFYLVPPQEKAPDTTVSNKKRVYEKLVNGTLRELVYQKDDWWKDYQK